MAALKRSAMAIVSVSEYYHEQTKYTPAGLQRGGRGLDFNKQPIPFKDYAGGTGYDLTKYLPEGEQLKNDVDLVAWREALPPGERDLAALSQLLYFTNGITAVIPYPGQPLLLRAAPSAGGLYPTEIYVAARGHALLPDGLYNYQVRDHSLVHFWAHDPWPRLNAATFDHPALGATGLVVLMTGVHFRSSWRYEDRAYRRILLDTGHVIGNLAMYAPLTGFHATPIGGFIDTALDDLLFLDAAEEGAIALFALTPKTVDPAVSGPTASPGPRHARQEVPEGQRLRALHEASRLPTGPAPSVPPPLSSEEDKYPFAYGEGLQGPPLVWDGRLGPTIIQRRSTRTFSGEGLTRAELATLLDFTYRPDLSPDPMMEHHPGTFAPELLQTFLAVHDVEGLDPGCYHYSPVARALRQIRFTSLREEVQYLALGQELAGQASVVVFHTADLPRAVDRYGDRAYRYLHLDAGHLGQRLNVAAIRMGLGVSGIGGFFDDQVNDMLGIPEREAVVYITTLGRPARSTRG
jgi:SagB-type dehydrogenase family enzyme